ncbi:hypothetical protein D3C73_890400 [compost metagenome]
MRRMQGARAQLHRAGDAGLRVQRIDDGLGISAQQARIVADQAPQRNAGGQVGPGFVFKGVDLLGGKLDAAGNLIK